MFALCMWYLVALVVHGFDCHGTRMVSTLDKLCTQKFLTVYTIILDHLPQVLYGCFSEVNIPRGSCRSFDPVTPMAGSCCSITFFVWHCRLLFFPSTIFMLDPGSPATSSGDGANAEMDTMEDGATRDGSDGEESPRSEGLGSDEVRRYVARSWVLEMVMHMLLGYVSLQ